MNYTAIACIVCTSICGYSQETITGLVKDAEGQGLAFANVLLLSAADSSFVHGAISDDAGAFSFEDVQEGSYRLSSSMVGFETVYTNPFSIQGNGTYTADPMVLSEGVALTEVEIVSKKPLYEQKIDRLIVNVENSIVSAGRSALDIIERSPGAVVNEQNSTITMLGKDGVVVMINGKINYMSGAALIQMLSGMSADNIQSIELITSPPANLDAEGNAGFINIVLKQDDQYGLNGSFSVSGGFGNGNVQNHSLNYNYRHGSVNLFGNLGFVRREQGEVWISDWTATGVADTMHEVTSLRDPVDQNLNLRLGADIQLTKNTVLGGLVSAYNSKWTMDAVNTGLQSIDDVLVDNTETINTERNQWKHLGGNINFRHTFTTRQSLNLDVDFLHYEDENPNDYQNTTFDASGVELASDKTRSDKTTPIDIVVGKADYHVPVTDNIGLDVGAKGIHSKFQNDVIVQNLNGSEWITDPLFSNSGVLNEEIYAAYTSVNIALSDRTQLKAGLRYEHTDSKLDTKEEGTVVDRQYGNFFPTCYIGHSFDKYFSLNVSYSKRITRPTFREIAPFVIFLDPTTFVTGNTKLQPAISQSAKLELKYRTAFLSLQYTLEDSSIARFQRSVVNNTLVSSPVNLKQKQLFAATVGLPFSITKWWELRTNVNFYSARISTYYEGRPVDFNNSYFGGNATSTINLDKGWGFETTFQYQGPAYSGSLYIKEQLFLSAGIAKDFGDQLGKLRFNVDDILDSRYWESTTNIPGENFTAYGKFDYSSRTFSLTYSRVFGNANVKAHRSRNTGSEEERARVE